MARSSQDFPPVLYPSSCTGRVRSPSATVFTPSGLTTVQHKHLLQIQVSLSSLKLTSLGRYLKFALHFMSYLWRVLYMHIYIYIFFLHVYISDRVKFGDSC